jgi:hypothetical protein
MRRSVDVEARHSGATGRPTPSQTSAGKLWSSSSCELLVAVAPGVRPFASHCSSRACRSLQAPAHAPRAAPPAASPGVHFAKVPRARQALRCVGGRAAPSHAHMLVLRPRTAARLPASAAARCEKQHYVEKVDVASILVAHRCARAGWLLARGGAAARLGSVSASAWQRWRAARRTSLRIAARVLSSTTSAVFEDGILVATIVLQQPTGRAAARRPRRRAGRAAPWPVAEARRGWRRAGFAALAGAAALAALAAAAPFEALMAL